MTTTDIKRAHVLLEPGKAAEMPCASLSLGRIFNGPIMTINLVNDSDRPIEVSVPDIYHEIGSTLRIGLDIKDRPSARPGLLAKLRERLRVLNDWLDASNMAIGQRLNCNSWAGVAGGKRLHAAGHKDPSLGASPSRPA